ncbi:MAG: hydrogenase nickel incorporation protein HypB [Deltaproteobacteria bacterium]|nr:hydrogenase nickel incorporation protein HypB [Deltaproteobacteria bacterium]
MKIKVVKDIVEANDSIARANREYFRKAGTTVFNLMSAPGAGKTTLLKAAIEKLKKEFRIGVIEGDIATTLDAEQIKKTGVSVVQINTGGACHLDANMIKNAVSEFGKKKLDIIIIENVGNLVCPAEFKVGEDYKIMIHSVTEGEDKPLKYPLMFKESSLLIISKIDLMEHLDVNLDKIKKDVLSLNPDIDIIEVSSKTGEGIDSFIKWIKSHLRKK